MTTFDMSHDSDKLTQYRSRKLAERLAANVPAMAQLERDAAVRTAVQAVADEAYAAARSHGLNGRQARDAAQAAAQPSVDEAVTAGLVGRGWSERLASKCADEAWNNDETE